MCERRKKEAGARGRGSGHAIVGIEIPERPKTQKRKEDGETISKV